MVPRSLAVLVPVVLLLSPLAASAQATRGYEMRPGDRVTVRVFTSAGAPVPGITGQRIIDLDSNIYMPYIGTVSVMGHDHVSLRQLFIDRYAVYYDEPVVEVEAELRVNVTGTVGAADLLYVDPSSTIISVIARAGGMSAEVVAPGQVSLPSDQSRVRLVRDGVTTILNLRPDEITTEVLNMRVQSGDWVHVPARSRSRVREELQFWGNVLNFVGNVTLLILFIT